MTQALSILVADVTPLNRAVREGNIFNKLTDKNSRFTVVAGLWGSEDQHTLRLHPAEADSREEPADNTS